MFKYTGMNVLLLIDMQIKNHVFLKLAHYAV